MCSQGAAQCYEQERAHTVSLPPCCAGWIFTVFYSSELGNKYGLMIDNRENAGTWSHRGVGADRLTDCRLQSLTTFKIKWSISNQLITLEIINSNKPKPQPRDNALTNASFLPSTK